MYFQIGVSRAISALRPEFEDQKFENIFPVGINPGRFSNANKVIKQKEKKNE